MTMATATTTTSTTYYNINNHHYRHLISLNNAFIINIMSLCKANIGVHSLGCKLNEKKKKE